jgi:hypothetical protein
MTLGGAATTSGALSFRSRYRGPNNFDLGDGQIDARSNFVGCSTGMSAGLAPRRILSTISAARRLPPLLVRAGELIE